MIYDHTNALTNLMKELSATDRRVYISIDLRPKELGVWTLWTVAVRDHDDHNAVVSKCGQNSEKLLMSYASTIGEAIENLSSICVGVSVNDLFPVGHLDSEDAEEEPS